MILKTFPTALVPVIENFASPLSTVTNLFSNAFSTFKNFPFGTASSSHLKESESSISIFLISAGVRSGFLANNNAAAPETIGVAIDVPDLPI